MNFNSPEGCYIIPGNSINSPKYYILRFFLTYSKCHNKIGATLKVRPAAYTAKRLNSPAKDSGFNSHSIFLNGLISHSEILNAI